MRAASVTEIGSLVIVILLVTASPCIAQTRLTSQDELRRELAVGDLITVASADGVPVKGRLLRVGMVDFELQPVGKRTPQERPSLDITIPLNAIQSLERRRDSVRNGAVMGASVGAGAGGALFVYALAVDRNEIDEWAGPYIGVTAVFTGIGALLGWAIDAVQSKPHVRFDASSAGKTKVSARPVLARGGGLAITVSF